MADLSASHFSIQPPSIEPALQMMAEQIDVLQRISSQIGELMQGVFHGEAIRLEDISSYEDAKSRVLTGLM